MNSADIARIDAQSIDRIFAEWDRPDSPGAAVALTLAGRVVYLRGFGAANLEYGLAVTPDTVFHVASVSKQFTAACVFSLALEGLVDLAADIHTYLPWVPDFGHQITAWHLIHHASGMRDQWQLARWAGWRMDDVITQEHLLRLIAGQRRLNFVPGSEHVYCNSGYTLLAEIVRAVSGKSLREFAAERIFGPLGMAQTFFFDDHEEIVPGRAYSYAARAGGGFRKSVLSFANVGATSLFTTARDLTRWLCHLDAIDGTALSSLLHSRLVLNSGEQHTYAGGLHIREYRGARQIGHSGSDAGYRSYCGRFPAAGLGVVILCNLGNMNPARLAQRVADTALAGLLQPAPARPTARTPASVNVDLKDYLGSYIASGAGTPIEISERDEVSLWGKLGDDVTSELVLIGRDEFWAPSAEQTVVFRRDQTSSAVSGLAMTLGSTTTHARRLLPDLEPSAADFYAGDYYSAELDTLYRVRAHGGQLVIRHQRLPELHLMPVGPDEFESPNPAPASIVFTGHPAGAATATGMRLTSTRCRDVAFDRVAGQAAGLCPPTSPDRRTGDQS